MTQFPRGLVVAAAGLESPNVFTGSDGATVRSGTPGGTFGVDSDLKRIVEAWPHLAIEQQQAVISIVFAPDPEGDSTRAENHGGVVAIAYGHLSVSVDRGV